MARIRTLLYIPLPVTLVKYKACPYHYHGQDSHTQRNSRDFLSQTNQLRDQDRCITKANRGPWHVLITSDKFVGFVELLSQGRTWVTLDVDAGDQVLVMPFYIAQVPCGIRECVSV